MEAIKNIQLEKIFKNLLIALIGTAVLTLSAKIKIPFYPVPMTMQTFVVLLIGITLGSRLGFLTVSLYLMEGIVGLPVFASSPEKGIGIIYFIGPTMGYLIGFLVAVYFAGSFKYNKGVLNNFLKIIFSVSCIYILGMVWLGNIVGWDKPIFELGAKPFLLAELFKVLLLLFIIPVLLKGKTLLKIT
jgi:biotin transport system substrate-specific component